MDGDVLKEKIFEALKKIPPSYYLPICIFGAGLIFLVTGLIQLGHPQEQSDALLPKDNTASATRTTVAVDVEGAVLRPGVYTLSPGSRLKDALIAAGGLSEDADRQLIAKQLNMAVKVTDGAKVYIPKIGDSASGSSGGTGTADTGQTLGATTGLININTATAESLDNLPGVGQVTAQKIINARPYGSVEELLSKKVVSNSVYQKIKEKISVF